MVMIDDDDDDDDDDGDQGFVYEGETAEGRVTVAARGISHTYTKLAELAFDSYRKCMSVIVKVTFTPLSSARMLSLFILGPGREDPRAEQGGGEHDAGGLRVGGPGLHRAAHHQPGQPRPADPGAGPQDHQRGAVDRLQPGPGHHQPEPGQQVACQPGIVRGSLNTAFEPPPHLLA